MKSAALASLFVAPRPTITDSWISCGGEHTRPLLAAGVQDLTGSSKLGPRARRPWGSVEAFERVERGTEVDSGVRSMSGSPQHFAKAQLSPCAFEGRRRAFMEPERATELDAEALHQQEGRDTGSRPPSAELSLEASAWLCRRSSTRAASVRRPLRA